MSKTAAVLLADGFETIEAFAPVDVLTRGGAEVIRVSCMESTTVLSAQGIPTLADVLLSQVNLADIDCLIVPGGMEGVNNLRRTPGVKEELHRRLEHNELLCVICAAPMLLAEEGLLKGRNATCYPGCDTDFPHHVRPAENGVYRDNNLISASGPAYALPFGIEIAKVLLGEGVGNQVAKDMLVKS